MNNPDYNPNVCSKDSYGNVTADNQDGEHIDDVKKYKTYKGYIIDFIVGINTIVWNEDESFFGKFPNFVMAKAAIDDAVKLK